MALSFQELFGPGGVASPPKHAAAGGEEEGGEGGGLADLTALVAGAVGDHVAHLSKGLVAPAAGKRVSLPPSASLMHTYSLSLAHTDTLSLLPHLTAGTGGAQGAGLLPSEKGTVYEVLRTFALKSRPESGLACIASAVLAR
jgi:hypothetical protein